MNAFQTALRLLSFRLTREEMLQFDRRHFLAGLVGTWIVGMGRYWDDPGAHFLQHAGLGSVIYIFVLSAFLWLLIKPFFVENWRYFTVLTFVALTSFPAIFYAIPVERFMDIRTANEVNVWFLAIVAAWRLALLFFFLKRFTQLAYGYIITAALMPMCLIIVALTALNLHRVVFNIMGGVRNPTPHDDAYFVLILLSVGSSLLIGPLLIGYGVGIYWRWKKRIKE